MFEEAPSMIRGAFQLDHSVVAQKSQLRLSGSGQKLVRIVGRDAKRSQNQEIFRR